jgi:hypothetical protein
LIEKLYKNKETALNNNLIKNIGFGNNATHTFDDHIGYSKIPTNELDEINHPIFILENITLTNKFNKQLEKYCVI